MTFLLPPLELSSTTRTAPPGRSPSKAPASSGTPLLSFFAPQELTAMARQAGFKTARHVSAAMLNDRYFTARTDGLRTSPGEELLVATM